MGRSKTSAVEVGRPFATENGSAGVKERGSGPRPRPRSRSLGRSTSLARQRHERIAETIHATARATSGTTSGLAWIAAQPGCQVKFRLFTSPPPDPPSASPDGPSRFRPSALPGHLDDRKNPGPLLPLDHDDSLLHEGEAEPDSRRGEPSRGRAGPADGSERIPLPYLDSVRLFA